MADKHKLVRRTIAEFLDTWEGAGYTPGYCIVRAVEEEGKPLRLERGKPVYLKDCPEARDWMTVYLRAVVNLRYEALAEEKRRGR